MFTRIQDDALNVGAILCLVLGIVILGPVVHGLRLLMVSLRGRTAPGHVEVVRQVKFDKYGDVIKWSSTVAYWAEKNGKRTQVRFHEQHAAEPANGKDVPVRYNPKRPEQFATTKPSRDLIVRMLGLFCVCIIFLALFFGWLYSSH